MTYKQDLVLNQGTTFSTTYTYTPTPNTVFRLSDYTLQSQMRKSFWSANAYTFAASADASGVLTLYMDANTSATIPPGRYIYDVDMISSANVSTRILEGIVTVKPTATILAPIPAENSNNISVSLSTFLYDLIFG